MLGVLWPESFVATAWLTPARSKRRTAERFKLVLTRAAAKPRRSASVQRLPASAGQCPDASARRAMPKTHGGRLAPRWHAGCIDRRKPCGARHRFASAPEGLEVTFNQGFVLDRLQAEPYRISPA